MSKKVISLAAMDFKRGIGKNQNLPWHLPNEYKHFVKISKTTKDKSKRNAVVMGRATWLSIPEKFRPLKDRFNVILSQTLHQSDLPDGVKLEKDLVSAIASLNAGPNASLIENIVLVGGERVYKEAIESNLCDLIYLTKIQGDFQCDVFFPEFDENIFKEVFSEEISKEEQTENGIKYTYHVYSNIKS